MRPVQPQRHTEVPSQKRTWCASVPVLRETSVHSSSAAPVTAGTADWKVLGDHGDATRACVSAAPCSGLNYRLICVAGRFRDHIRTGC